MKRELSTEFAIKFSSTTELESILKTRYLRFTMSPSFATKTESPSLRKAFGGWFNIIANPKNLKVVSRTRRSAIKLKGGGAGGSQSLVR